jgi:glycosyltransferase involved in cell wall biosynthesis
MEKPIRVLLIAPSMHILGGQAVQAKWLLASLREIPWLQVGFQPINPRLPGVLVKLHSIRFLRTAITFLIYFPMLMVRAPRYDILHVFSAAYWSYSLWTLPALFFAKLYRKKIILHYHDGQAEDHLKNWRSAIPTIRMMDAIVSPSGFLADLFAKFGFHVQPIFNIIDMSLYRYRKRSQLRPIFLHNRILEPLYNVQCTLRAFAIIQQRYPEARLTVAHDGPSGPELERFAQELGLRNTEFVGRVPHDRIAALYDSVDIYLTSPNFDCMPVSLLECFASGLPVIATNVGGIPYISSNEETALLVPCNDHQAMAERAFRLLENEALVERLTARAYEECKRYGAGPSRDRWLALYRQLMGLAPTSLH